MMLSVLIMVTMVPTMSLPITDTTIRIQRTVQQGEFVDSNAPNVVLQGGAGSGKTWAGVLKAMRLAAQGERSRGMIVAPSYPQLQQAVIPHLISLAGKFGLLYSWDWNKQQNHIKLASGSEIWLRSADNPSALLGADLAWCVGDEVGLWKKLSYDYLMGRLRQRGHTHQAAFTFTPKGMNWCYERLGVARKGLHIVRATTYDNVFLGSDYHERLKREYGEGSQLWRQEVLGEYVAWEGLVYPQFSVDTHVTELPEDLKLVRVVGAADWGWSNPGVLLVLGLDTEDNVYVLDEVYERNQQVAEWWAPEALKLSAQHNVTEWYCDPSEPANISAFNRAGVSAEAANNSVIPGISAVAGRVANRTLRIAPHCVNTIKEMQTYCWKRRADGETVKDTPEKLNDHAMDALRYGMMGLMVVKRKGFARSW